MNQKQVKQFVATGSYYRRFIKDFAKIARPLTELTKKDVKFTWTDECEHAFQKLKERLTSTEVMNYPLTDAGTFYLDVDASGVGIGGVLSQIQSGQERYRPGKRQQNCYTLSRCENPRDCECNEVDMTEVIKCGPCRKCKRRAETMALEKPNQDKPTNANNREDVAETRENKKEKLMNLLRVVAQ